MVVNRARIPAEIWALIIGGFCIALGIGIVAPIIPQLAKSFGVSVTAASAVVSAFALMRIVAAPLAGWYVGRTNERSGYMTGLLLVALTTFACGFADNYPALLIFRTLSGVGSVIFTVAASTLLIKLTPAHMRGRVLSYNAASFLLGALIGPAIGAAVTTISLQAPFFVYTGLLVIALLYVGIVLGKIKQGPNSAENSQNDVVFPLRTALSSKPFLAACYSGFVTGWAVWGVRITIVPLFVAYLVQDSVTAAGWALAAYAAGNAMLVIPSGRWNDKFGRKPLILIGFTISAVTYGLLPVAQNLETVMLIMFISGLGSALFNPAQNAVVADVIGNRNGAAAISAHSVMLDLGSVIGPLLIGAVADASGYPLAFALSSVLLVSVLLVWVFTPETNKFIGQNLRNSAGATNLEVGPETGAIPIIRNDSGK